MVLGLKFIECKLPLKVSFQVKPATQRVYVERGARHELGTQSDHTKGSRYQKIERVSKR